jgi:oligoribonuclease NrnB/cAMP/cGMP phosphodiesterase (DHH superfamily)
VVKVFYHADLDGECAAAVVNWWSKGLSETFYGLPIFWAIDYKDEFPFDAVREGEEVFILDFSLQQLGDWDRLFATGAKIVWIDHHKTAIEAADADPRLRRLEGVRREGRGAGCELTWLHFFPGQPEPLAVALVGDYDTWTFEYGDRTRNFKAYMEAVCDTRPLEGWNETWQYLIPGAQGDGERPYWTQAKWASALDTGAALLRARARDAENSVSSWAFEVDFEGLRGIAINRRGINSDFFASVAADYDLLLPFVFDGRQWTVSLYRGGRQPDLDCSAIAKRHGGGGHPGASGFQCGDLPWTVTGQGVNG